MGRRGDDNCIDTAKAEAQSFCRKLEQFEDASIKEQVEKTKDSFRKGRELTERQMLRKITL